MLPRALALALIQPVSDSLSELIAKKLAISATCLAAESGSDEVFQDGGPPLRTGGDYILREMIGGIKPASKIVTGIHLSQ